MIVILVVDFFESLLQHNCRVNLKTPRYEQLMQSLGDLALYKRSYAHKPMCHYLFDFFSIT